MDQHIQTDQPVVLAQAESIMVLASNVAICAIAFRDQLLGSAAAIPPVCQEIELSLEASGSGAGTARIVARSTAD